MENTDRRAPKHPHRRNRAKKPPLFPRLRKILGIDSGYENVNSDGVDSTLLKIPTDGRKFLAGPDGVHVFVVPNFLDTETAERWRDVLAYEWRQKSAKPPSPGGGEGSDTAYPPQTGGVWAFETAPLLPLSSSDEGAPAADVVDTVKYRNDTAHKSQKGGSLAALARWELDAGHPLHKEIKTAFLGPDVMDRVRTKGGGVGKEIELNLSVEHYAPGDFFLGAENGRGKVAGNSSTSTRFVFSLLAPLAVTDQKERSEKRKSGLPVRFQCQFDDARCESVRLGFNSAVLMPSTGSEVLHEILPIPWEEWTRGTRHFAVTGWYRFNAATSQKVEL